MKLRFDELLDLRNAALNSEDIEGVHRMRVAIRRLRSALGDFSAYLEDRSFKAAKKKLKRLADSLGMARDQDVAIAALQKLQQAAKGKRIKNDLEDLIVKRLAKRKNTQTKLNEILASTSIENLREHFSAAFEEGILKETSAFTIAAKYAGREVVSKRLQEFLNLSSCLYDPFNQDELHQLRIAAKRLRYSIELFTGCLGEQITPFAKQIADMQAYLGELHDCDVWIKDLSRRLLKKQSRKPRTDLWLLARFTKDRTKNYRSAIRLWSEWRKDKFFRELRIVLQSDST